VAAGPKNLDSCAPLSIYIEILRPDGKHRAQNDGTGARRSGCRLSRTCAGT